jgi:regulator of replication initiation timing
MSQLNIVQLIEQNPLVRLSQTYHGRLINKIKEVFTNEEQQLFVSSFYCYLNYNKNADFVIDLDNVWKWLEFSNKDKAKRLLEKSFIENTDYKCLLTPKEEQKTGRGGHNKETILLTIKAFKSFCLKACTKKADQIHEYYLKMEETLQEVINEESNELRLQLENKSSELTNVLRTSQTEKERIREKTLLEQFSENDQCVYYGLIDNTNDKSEKLIKFGNSNSLRLRIAAHKKTYSNFRLVNAFKVDNKIQIENAIKNHTKLAAYKRTITINNKNYTEILCVDDLTFDTIDKIIQDVIVGIEYNIDNYNKLLKDNERLNNKIKELYDENENLRSIKNTAANNSSGADDYRNLLNNFMTANEENKRLKIENQRLMKKLKKTGEEINSNDYLTMTNSIKRIAKGSDGLYHIGNDIFEKCFGNRAEVWNGVAYKTSGELLKSDLMINKKGKLVSKSKFLHETLYNRFSSVNNTD